MATKSQNNKKQESRLDSDTQQCRVNGKQKIGNKEYEAELFKLQVELASSRSGSRRPTHALSSSSRDETRPERAA